MSYCFGTGGSGEQCMRDRIQCHFKTKTIVCTLWLLDTIKILCENMDSTSVESVMNGCVSFVFHPISQFSSSSNLFWLDVEFSVQMLYECMCLSVSVSEYNVKVHVCV